MNAPKRINFELKSSRTLSMAVQRAAALLLVAASTAVLAAGGQATAALSAGATGAAEEPAAASRASLAALVEEAQKNNPEVLAARRAWQASAQVPSQVSTLPDPEVMVQHVSAGTPIPFWGYNTVEMTFTGLGVSQALPYPGKLRLRGEVARRQAAAEGDRLESVRRTVTEQVKVAYYRLSYLQATLEILARDGKLLEQIEKIAEARYRVGQSNQQDVLKAQLEQTRLLRDVTESRQQLGSQEALLKQLLNRAPDSADITAEPLAETPLPFGLDDLVALVRTGNPEVSTRQQMVRSKSLGVELARKDYYPDFNIQYMWEHTAGPFPDRYALGLGIKIPVYRSRRQNPELAQAAEELNQSRREYEAQIQQTSYEVKDQFLAADSGAKVLKIYRQGLIPQASAAFHAAMASYQTGQEDFQSLLDSFRDLLNLDKEYWRTLAEHESALARLEQLTGAPLS